MSFKQADVGKVPANWSVEELRAFCSLITYGFTNPMPDAKQGPWKLTAKDVVDGRINYDTARRTTQDAFDRLTDKSRPKVGDVLLTKDGSIGRVAVVDRDGICINQSVALIRPNDRISPDFLKYLLFSPHYQKVMEGDSDGSTIKHIYITRVDKMQVAVPPIEEQKSILTVVKSIDDRITLLRETNTTLEAIAQALFKSWFVDFDPVHAKMQGLAPEGMDEATAALFPNSFEDSELGPVPKSWQRGTLKNLLSESTSRIGKLKSIVLSAVQTGHLVPSDEHFTKKVYSANISKYKLVQPLAFAYNPSRINIGSIGLNETENTGAVSPIYVVASANSKGRAYFIWHHLRTKRVKELISNLASGTVRQSVSFRDFGSIPLVIPNDVVLDFFYQIREIIYSKVKANNTSIETLIEARDTLLPRLISGQLRIEEAQETIA